MIWKEELEKLVGKNASITYRGGTAYIIGKEERSMVGLVCETPEDYPLAKFAVAPK